MSKVRVAIDTSILRGDGGLSSGPMEALTRFAANGHVEILVPSVVAREFISKPSPRIEAMEELRKALKNLKKTGLTELHRKITDFETSVEEEFDRHETLAKQRFAEWEKRTGAVILPPAADHAAKVMDKYFAGTLPFKSEKARADLPDALLVEAILDLMSQGPMFALAHDGRVAEALKAHPGLKVFPTVKALLESDDFQDALGDIDEIDGEHEQANVEKVVTEFLRDNTKFRSSMEDDVSRLVAGKTLNYRNPNYDEKEGPDEIYVDSVQEVSGWTFDGTSDYLGEGVALVNFEASVEIDADDPMGGSWYDDDGNPDSSRTVRVSGAVSISINLDDLWRDPAKTSGLELLNAAAVGIDELDDISLVSRSY
jgi:hypothetical protein